MAWSIDFIETTLRNSFKTNHSLLAVSKHVTFWGTNTEPRKQTKTHHDKQDMEILHLSLTSTYRACDH